MKLLKIEFWNFGSYRGHQVLNLDVSTSAPVVLVHGENMRGKTTILRGIRWALYGEVRGHDGTLIPAEDFANYEERDSSDEFEFGVKLTFEDRGSVNEIARMCTAIVDEDLISRRVNVKQISTSLKPTDGNPIPERDIPEFVARTLHKDIADFFLFDGEMLTRFEESLRSDSTRAGVVKRSIERVLGLPALQNAQRDAATLLKDADSVLRRAAKRRQDAAKVESDYGQTESELERLRNDIQQLQEHRLEIDAEVSRLGDDLSQVESVKEMYYQRRNLEAEILELDTDIADFEADLRSRIAECWWVPLASAIQARIASLDEELEAVIEAARQRDLLTFELRQLTDRPQARSCPMCHQDITPEHEAELQHRQKDLEQQLEALPTGGADLGELHAERKRLSQYADAALSAERIRDAETDLERQRIRRADKQEQVAELNDLLRDTRLDIAAVESNYQQQRDLLRDVDRAIENAGVQEDQLTARLRQLSQELAKLAGGQSPERAERDVLDALVSGLEMALDAFRDGMRKQVEQEASSIFNRLSTEPTYSGLRIDGRYFLEIIDDRDQVIRRRSAGADQIVTMSLIGALVRCAVRQGPVVMDTPFGRLDRGHRERILKWVPTLGTQVVLFVQSGEFDRERDLAFLDGMIGREYNLRRITSKHTSIESVSG